eukprot:4037300-Pleurochrysis_carterae.AAC.1
MRWSVSIAPPPLPGSPTLRVIVSGPGAVRSRPFSAPLRRFPSARVWCSSCRGCWCCAWGSSGSAFVGASAPVVGEGCACVRCLPLTCVAGDGAPPVVVVVVGVP